MKNIFYALSLLLVLSSCEQSNASQTIPNTTHTEQSKPIDTSTSNYTTIKWITDSVHFGNYKEGKTVQIEFKFKNIGNKVLILSDVRTSCGCTITEYPKKAIPVGGTGTIKAIYNSKGMGTGFIKKSVIVSGNFNATPKYLYFTGNIN